MDIGLIMGSSSDIEVTKKVTKVLKKLGLSYGVSVVSAHRVLDVLKEAVEKDDCKVYVTIVEKAIRLGGVTIRITAKPVVGAPVKGPALAGMDVLHSIIQMLGGVLVAAVAIDGGENAAILAAQTITLSDEKLARKLKDYKEEMERTMIDSNKELEEI